MASSSPYRKALLERLQLEFITESPEITEEQKQNESIKDMVIRLAEEKARRVAENYSEGLIIGSDQAVGCDGTILVKPGTHNKARQQLTQMSGKSLIFHTGLCVLNVKTQILEKDAIDYAVKFRILSEEEIERYLDKEQPYNCAGSFKSEQLGISLLEKTEGEDPTSLIGLPLISLCKMLRNQGIHIP